MFTLYDLTKDSPDILEQTKKAVCDGVLVSECEGVTRHKPCITNRKLKYPVERGGIKGNIVERT